MNEDKKAWIAYFYSDANQLSYRMQLLPVGRCQALGCPEWGLRHYAYESLSLKEAVRCSKILCPEHAKRAKK